MNEQELSVPVPIQQAEPAPVPIGSTARRPGRALRVSALVALMAFAAVLLGYLAWDDSRYHDRAAQETRRAARLTSEVHLAQNEVASLNLQLASAQNDNARLRTEAHNPTLAMWNSCGGPCMISPTSVRVGSVPDTFQLQIKFTADVPVRVYLFTFRQWTQFDACGFNARCVSGSYKVYDAATSLSQNVDAAEGCAGYVWVLQSDREGTIKPDVKVHYQPASQPTGVCAVNP